MNNCVAAHGSFQKLVHGFFFCIAFTPLSLNFFNRVASLKQKNNGFRLTTSIDFEGRPFVSCFAFRII